MFRVSDGEHAPVNAHDANAEEIARHVGQGRIDLGVLSQRDGGKAFVGLRDQACDMIGRRKAPCRDIGALRVEEGIQ